MRRPRLAVDLDGVVYDYHSTLRYLLETYRNKRLPPVEELFKRWDGHLQYISTDDDKWAWTEGVEKYGLFRHGHVLKGAIDALGVLSQEYDLIICTHRPRNAAQDTLEWIAFNRIPCKEVVLLWHNESKTDVEADAIIDDKPENVIDFLVIGRKGILWQRPWNKYIDTVGKELLTTSPNAYTTSDWWDAVRWLRINLGRKRRTDR